MGVTQYTFSAEQWERVLMSSAATRTNVVYRDIMCCNSCRKPEFFHHIFACNCEGYRFVKMSLVSSFPSCMYCLLSMQVVYYQ